MRLATIILAVLTSLTSTLAQAPEELFLDLIVAEVANGTSGIRTVEPWTTMYCNAVAEGRYGDAIYARYNIDGRSSNGTFHDTNRTIIEEIEVDAISYHSGYPDTYAAALSFYSSNSVDDYHPEIIETIRQVSNGTLARRDITYGIYCSGNNLAEATQCSDLLEYLGDSRTTWYGSRRAVDYFGDCHLRLGPLGSRQDSSQKTIHSVADLIYEECRRTKACCTGLFVSGYSPVNSGHRKICLSKKSTGCS